MPFRTTPTDNIRSFEKVHIKVARSFGDPLGYQVPSLSISAYPPAFWCKVQMDASKKTTLQSTCHCKTVVLGFPYPEEPLNECLCSICRCYGALWAYYQPEEVQIIGETEFYIWGDEGIQFHRCEGCGCVTHWEPADKIHKRLAVNCPVLELEDLKKLPVKKSDGPERSS